MQFFDALNSSKVLHICLCQRKYPRKCFIAIKRYVGRGAHCINYKVLVLRSGAPKNSGARARPGRSV